MPKGRETKKISLDKATVSKIMRTVSRREGFEFYKALGESSGKVATSLTDFLDKMGSVDIRSVNFHSKRQDFEKWVRDILGDVELSRRLGRTRREAHGEQLRKEIMQVLRSRIDELKGILVG